jgi:predicted nucleotidyltransferase
MNTALMTELLGGSGRFRALQCLYAQADRTFGTRELASAAHIDPANASRWLRRWADVGLLERLTERGQSVFKASRDPSLAPLKLLLQQEGELASALRQELKALPVEVEAAAIFGSMASGEADADSDVDVLLIAPDISRLDAQAHFKPLGRKLGRPINVQLDARRSYCLSGTT